MGYSKSFAIPISLFSKSFTPISLLNNALYFDSLVAFIFVILFVTCVGLAPLGLSGAPHPHPVGEWVGRPLATPFVSSLITLLSSKLNFIVAHDNYY